MEGRPALIPGMGRHGSIALLIAMYSKRISLRILPIDQSRILPASRLELVLLFGPHPQEGL